MQNLRGCLLALGVIINTVAAALILFVMAPLKALPGHAVTRNIRRWSASVAENWIGINSALVDTTPIKWTVDGPDDLDPAASYIVVSNHQSWVDIVVLQRLFNRRIPFMRFFIKQQLIWVPVIGLAWWVLDFPFMKRYNREQLRKNPELKGRDLETARKACEKFRDLPTSMMSFLEGTRFTRHKHDRQESPYTHLLRPKIGGIAQVLHSLGDTLAGIVDATIVYPRGVPGMWDLLCGRIPEVSVHIRCLDIDKQLVGRDIREDQAFRERLSRWVDQLWCEKDARIEQSIAAYKA